MTFKVLLCVLSSLTAMQARKPCTSGSGWGLLSWHCGMAHTCCLPLPLDRATPTRKTLRQHLFDDGLQPCWHVSNPPLFAFHPCFMWVQPFSVRYDIVYMTSVHQTCQVALVHACCVLKRQHLKEQVLMVNLCKAEVSNVQVVSAWPLSLSRWSML